MITLTSQLYLVKAETERLGLSCGDGCRRALEAFSEMIFHYPDFHNSFKALPILMRVTHHFEL